MAPMEHAMGGADRQVIDRRKPDQEWSGWWMIAVQLAMIVFVGGVVVSVAMTVWRVVFGGS